MPRTPMAYVDIRFSAHATEDPGRVVEAVRNILPPSFVDCVKFERSSLRGHYGNPIVLFETRIKGNKIVQALIENLASRLHEQDKESLFRNIDRHVGEGSLYLRLDKQAALHGEVRLCAADPVRVRVRFRKGKTEDIVRFCREVGMLS